MPHPISARLTTLCGCRQFVTIDGPAPSEYKVPIKSIALPGNGSGDRTALHLHRTFKLVSFNPPDASVEADYVESL